MIETNGISLYVEEHGEGIPVLMLHGWPDSARLWRHQVPVLAGRGYRVITPDLRGFGRSAQPGRGSLLRAAERGRRHHRAARRPERARRRTWSATTGARRWPGSPPSARPDRVRTLTAISVPHPLAPPTMRQHEMAWYQLFFQFYGVAEATIQHDDWAWLRMMTRGDGDLGQAIEDLSRPGALTASLNWYRANRRAADAGPRAHAAAGRRADAGHLVNWGSLPRR